MKNLVAVLIISFITACDSSNISGNDYTVIDYDKKSMYWIFKQGTITSLSRSEIIEIEELIADRIQTKIINTKYRRQYVPIIDTAGEKHVWVNFFCHISDDEKWKKELKQFRDGGDCFFQIRVNLTRKFYYEYRVNGIALLVKPLPNKGNNPLLTPYEK